MDLTPLPIRNETARLDTDYKNLMNSSDKAIVAIVVSGLVWFGWLTHSYVKAINGQTR